MIPRRIRRVLRDRLKQYPAVGLVGPRQSGKTTLARQFRGEYFDIEQDVDRLRLDVEWERLVRGRRLVILDEAQTWPELFPRLRGTVDADRKRNGRFLLLGSISPSLSTQIAESLAGRLSLVELTPLTWGELPQKLFRDRLWYYGGFPDGGILDPNRFPRWQLDYLTLLTQRDLPNWGLQAPPAFMQRVLRMLALAHGQIWNASQIGQSLGVSYHLVNRYVDYLEGAFLVRRLPPYHANIRKRLLKRPKFYWRDSGLLHALLHVTDASDVLLQPWVGASWEGFVIEQVLAALQQADRHFQPYFMRTSDQREIDLIVETGRELWAIEAKLTSNPSIADVKKLAETADLIGATRKILVCQTRRTSAGGDRVVCNLSWLVGQILRGSL